MPATGKRKTIEEKLGEPLAKFITRRARAGHAIKAIAKDLGIDPKEVRHYLNEYDGHLDVCVCPVCSVPFCLMKVNSHKEGRCIIRCLDFKNRNTQ